MRRVVVFILAVPIALTSIALLLRPTLAKSAPQDRIIIRDGRPPDHPIRVAKETAANAIAPFLPWLFRQLAVDVSVSVRSGGVRLTLKNASFQDVWLEQLEIPSYIARRMSLGPPAGMQSSNARPARPPSASAIPTLVWVGHIRLPANSQISLLLPCLSPTGHFEVTVRLREDGDEIPAHSISARTTLKAAPSGPAV